MTRISVVMPVWNGEAYLRQAVESILSQTFSDFELLVVDDGSTDTTLQILHSYKDPRLRILKREHEGIVCALNYGVMQAQSDWIARMDADDIAMPHRLTAQWDLLQKHPEAVLCHSDVKLFGDASIPPRQAHLPSSRALLALRLCFQCPIVHTSVVFNKKAFLQADGYAQAERHAEDFGLWGRLIEQGPFVAVRESLVQFRLHEQSVSRQSSREQTAVADKIALSHCHRFLQLEDADAARAYDVLRKIPRERKMSEWFWFLRRCAPRLKWKSLESMTWLITQTLRKLI